jgi:hypothetical protein
MFFLLKLEMIDLNSKEFLFRVDCEFWSQFFELLEAIFIIFLFVKIWLKMGFSWSETDQPNFLTTGGDMNLCSASDASSTILFFSKTRNFRPS